MSSGKEIQLKILQDNYHKDAAAEIKCSYCESLLAYTKSDLTDDEHGESFLVCPCCHERIYPDFIGNESDRIPVYPYDFFEFTKVDGAVALSDKDVNEYVKSTYKTVHDSSSEDDIYSAMASGDTFVISFKRGDEFQIVVAKHPSISTVCSHPVIVAKDYYEYTVDR